jgi:hypothetical protein
VKPIVADKPNRRHIVQPIEFGRYDRFWIIIDNLKTDLALAADIRAVFALV